MMPTSAAAQTTGSPPGAVRGLFGGGSPPSPGRSTQQVSLWFDLGGGYDQDLGVSGVPDATNLEGYAGTVVGTFRYWRGRTTRNLEASARIFRNTQSAEQTTATGGEVNVGGNLVGRRAGASMQLRASNDSAVLFGALGPAFPEQPDVDDALTPPDVSPPQGIVEDRWLAFGGNGSAYRNWSPRQRTTVQYTQLHRRPRQGQGLDSNYVLGLARQDWTFRPNATFQFGYRFERIQQDVQGSFDVLDAPVQLQTAEAGFRYERPLSPIRTVSFGVTGGATQVFEISTPLANLPGNVEPVGTVTAGYTLTRRWLLSASLGRGVTVLQGISPEPFTNDAASVSVTGVMWGRMTVLVSGTVSRGLAVGPTVGSFEATGGTASVRYGFRYGGVFIGYTRYEHQLQQTLIVPGTIPRRFDQHSVRAGLTIWLPLYGGF